MKRSGTRKRPLPEAPAVRAPGEPREEELRRPVRRQGIVLLATALVIIAAVWLLLALRDQKQAPTLLPSPTTVLSEPPATTDGETEPTTTTFLTAWPLSVRQPGKIIIGVNQRAATLDPLAISSDLEQEACAILFESLAQVNSSGIYCPVLATAWSFSSADRVMRVSLATDRQFSDGSFLTSDDVVRVYQTLLADHYEGPFRGRVPQITAVRADGPQTVLFDLAGTEDPDPRFLTIGISKRLAESSQLIGTSPFRLDHFESTVIRLTRITAEPGLPTEFEIRQIPAEQKYSLLQEGALDVIRCVWDTRTQQRAQTLNAYLIHPLNVSPESFLLISLRSGSGLITPQQRRIILDISQKRTASQNELDQLQALRGQTLTLRYYSIGTAETAKIWHDYARSIVQPLLDARLLIDLLPVAADDLTQTAVSGDYDLLLMPAPDDNRLPSAICLHEPDCKMDSDGKPPPNILGIVARYRPEAYFVHRRVLSGTVASKANPFSYNVGSWFADIRQIRLSDN